LRRYDYGWKAVRWAQDWGAELIYTRLPQAAARASLLGLPTLFEVHDFPQGRLGPLLFQAFLRGRGACRLVSITRSLLDDLATAFHLPKRPAFALVAPDGVDLERYQDLPAPEEARLQLPAMAGRGFTAGYTGHLYPGRGAELLLNLASRLPEMTFLLAGGEPADVRRFEGEAGRQGLENVLLPGFVPNAELPAWQAACDVLLMPYERRVAASSGGDIARYLSPMKLFEYLACGRPILSSDLPPLREVLTPEIAVLLPPGDVETWTFALRDLCQDPHRRASLASAARIAAQGYGWEGRAARILEGIPAHA
jgi:glycosyltransferase involved in cell wall biosynthesis